MSKSARSDWPAPLRRLRASVVVVSALLVGGCLGGGLESAGGLFTHPSAPANEGFDQRETALGQREHPRIVTAFGGTYVEPDLQTYLDATVEDLRQYSDRPELGYRVTVLNSPSINAFSLPGGYIYVTRGLLALANDSAEIAAVLAHEMAHVTARHAIQREEQAVSASIVSQVVSDIVRDPEAGAAAMALSRGRLAQFSRQQELEADVIGIRTAARAGYDPQGANDFLRSLERQTELHTRTLHQEYDAARVDIFATHPATPQRIIAAEREARIAERPADAQRDKESYFRVINGLPYGDDPSEGFVAGRTFLHPELGFTFTLPEGYALENTPRAVVGFSPSGDIVRFDTVTVASATGLAEYLSEEAVRGGDVGPVEETRIDGLQAALATVRGDAWDFRVAAIRGRGTTVYRFILASRELDSAREAELAEAAMTFRMVPPREARQVRQLRISVVRAGPGDTVESISRAMAYDDYRVERLRALNGFSPSDRVRPGDLVKIIVR